MCRRASPVKIDEDGFVWPFQFYFRRSGRLSKIANVNKRISSFCHFSNLCPQHVIECQLAVEHPFGATAARTRNWSGGRRRRMHPFGEPL